MVSTDREIAVRRSLIDLVHDKMREISKLENEIKDIDDEIDELKDVIKDIDVEQLEDEIMDIRRHGYISESMDMHEDKKDYKDIHEEHHEIKSEMKDSSDDMKNKKAERPTIKIDPIFLGHRL